MRTAWPTVRRPALEPLRRTMEGLGDHDHSSTSCYNNLTEPAGSVISGRMNKLPFITANKTASLAPIYEWVCERESSVPNYTTDKDG